MSTATPAPSSGRSSPRRWSASSRRPGVEISASTRLLGVIGGPIAHSLSPTMYNAAFRALGLDAVYVALPTPAAALSSLLSALVGIGAAGNVTVPHKEAVERCCARKTDLCARVGACNTFWTEQGQLVGDNTDVAGVLSALRALGGDGAGRWLVLRPGRAPLGAAAPRPRHCRRGWPRGAGAPGGGGVRPFLPRPARASRGDARRREPRPPCLTPSNSCSCRRSASCAAVSCPSPTPTAPSAPCVAIAGAPCGRRGASVVDNRSHCSAAVASAPTGRRPCSAFARRCGSRAAL